MCEGACFAARQQMPTWDCRHTTAAGGPVAHERCTAIWLCSAGACAVGKLGYTTEENELAEQLLSELLFSSGSSSACPLDGGSADAASAVAIGRAAAALADLLCHEGCPDEAAAATWQLFPRAQSLTVHCSTANCPGQLTLALQQHNAGRAQCDLVACTCSAADVLLRSAAVCTLEGGQESEAEQAALAALGEMLGKQLRQHVKQQLEVLHATVASLRIQDVLARCGSRPVEH